MMFTTFGMKFSHGFSGPGGFELDVIMLSIAISLLLSGPGRISIERDLLKREIFPKVSYNIYNDGMHKKYIKLTSIIDLILQFI
jgi:hypothetical protein